MKLLIITQKVDLDDDVLGFFHRWIEEFAKHCESLLVICLQKGKSNLPKNVKILSLGKESGRSNLKYLRRFYKYIWQERKNYDWVFVHMNVEYVILGGVLWKFLHKKICLWYAHGRAFWLLKFAGKLADVILTSTKSGCRVISHKIRIIGQGIDTELFKPVKRKFTNGVFKIITIGRISPVKDYETMIRAMEILAKEQLNFVVEVVGGAELPEHKEYLKKMIKLIENKKLGGIINFIGPIPNREIAKLLNSADLFINMSHTGSLDKAILEAMSCGLPILTCNEALEEVLGNYQEILMYPKGNGMALAGKVRMIIKLSPAKREEMAIALREIVVKKHSLNNFIKKILEIIK